jgi:hypothetical protein
MSEELKPCPFCGSSSIRLRRYFGECESCGAGGPEAKSPCEGEHPVEYDVERSWNTRAALQAGAVPDGWRTIESAPKDGTHVLLGYFHHEGVKGSQLVAFWHSTHKKWCNTHMLFEAEGPFSPSHWKPLDAAPGSAVQPAKMRMLTEEEIAAAAERHLKAEMGDDVNADDSTSPYAWVEGEEEFAKAVMRRFCEVNGLEVAP